MGEAKIITRAELISTVNQCRETWEGPRVAGPIPPCPVSTFEDYQRLQEIIHTKSPPGDLSGTFLWETGDPPEPLLLQDIPDSWKDSPDPRKECIGLIASEGYMGMALEIDSKGPLSGLSNPQPSKRAQVLKGLRLSWHGFVQKHAIVVPSSVDEAEAKEKLAVYLGKLCPQKHWKGTANPETYLTSLPLDAVESLYNGPYLFFQFIRQGEVRSQITALFAESIDREWCTQISTLALDLMEAAGNGAWRVLNLPEHLTLALPLESGEIYFNNGMELLPPGFFDREKRETGYAQRTHQSSLEAWQICSDHHNNLSGKALGKENLELADSEVKKALEINPQNTNALRNLGTIFLGRGYPGIANGYFSRAHLENPALLSTLVDLGRINYEQGFTEEARRILERAYQLSRDDPDTLYDLARVYLHQMEDSAVAIRLLIKVLRFKPDHADALNNLGHIFLSEGEPGIAKGYFERALKADPKHLPALINLGAVHYEQGFLKLARRAWERGMLLAPDDPDLITNLAHLYIDLGLGTEAREMLTKAIAIDPANLAFKYRLWVLCDQ